VKRLDHALFRCARCEREWRDELPPLWSGLEMWPECCLQFALLVQPVARRGLAA